MFLVNYPSVKVLLTDLNSAFAVTILDPCDTPSITTTALTNQIYYVSSGPKSYQAAAYTVYQSWCDVTYSYSSSNPALDTAISFDASSLTFTFDYATDLNLSGPVAQSYTLTMSATSNLVTESESFIIEMKNPCIVASVNTIALPTVVTNQTYFIGAGKLRFSVQNLVSPPFQAKNTLCGDVEFTAELVYKATLPTPSDPVPLNSSNGVVKFYTDGTFVIESSDATLLGVHELLISGSLVEYPA